MQNAIAFCDNDVVVVAWSYGHKVEGCMGFAVYRIDSAGKETALPSMAVSPASRPSAARRRSPARPGSLKPMTISFLVSNEIEIGPLVAPKWRAFFNRGLISTQRVSTALGGMPAKGALLAAIATRGGKLRVSLAGDMIAALLDFVRRAKAGGALYAALYELGDDELISALEGAGKRLHLVLSHPDPGDGRARARSPTATRRRARAWPRPPAS